MNVIVVAIVTLLLCKKSEEVFDPQIRVLGNIVMSIGNHLFARFTDTEMPTGHENGTFIEQVDYIHKMILKMRDYFVNPPEELREQLRALVQSFSFQVKVQLPKLDIEENDLKEKFNLNEDEIKLFHSMADDCKRFVDEIIVTRGAEIPDKYV